MAEKEFVAKITADTSQVDGALNKTADALNNVAQAEENVADSANKMGTHAKSTTTNPDFTKKSELKEATILEKSTLGKEIVLYNAAPYQPV